jgi:AcrR family transcriptional regulator
MSKKYHHGDLKNALILAGIEIVSQEGIKALSLRKVAQRVGVSHSAPYAHFTDKQALIAAISTEGYKKLHASVSAVAQQYQNNPQRQLVEGAWAYVEFATAEPDHFKITFSGVIEKEQAYPAFVEISHQSFALLVEIVQNCQRAGILKPGPTELLAVTVWGLMHGVISLILEGQLSHTILEQFTRREILIAALNQIMVQEFNPSRLA